MSQKDQKRHPRQGIVNLSQAVYKNFKPLVNEKQEVTGFELLPGRLDHTRDQLLMLIVAALADLNDFIKKYEEIKDKYEQLTADAMMAYVAGKERGIEAESLSELMDSLSGKFQQACDVLTKIKETSNDPATKAVAEQFLSRFVIESSKVVRPNFGATGASEEPNSQPPQAS